MGFVLLMARVALAVVFAIAGLAKLADQEGSRRALREFGVPAPLQGLFGIALPIVELMAAILLLPAATAWWGAMIAVVLLAVFTIAIAVKVARGETPDCHCFGELHSEPVGRATLVRNLVFLSLAGSIVIFGAADAGPSALAWLGALSASEAASLALSLITIGLLASLAVWIRQLLDGHSRLLTRIEDLEFQIERGGTIMRDKAAPAPGKGSPVGAPAPDFALRTLDGASITRDELLANGRGIALFFLSPGCNPCRTLLPEIAAWEREWGEKLAMVVISKGDLAGTREEIAGYGIKHLLLAGDSGVADKYQAKWTPGAVLIDRGGRIGSQLAYGADAIRALIDHAVKEESSRPWLGAEPASDGLRVLGSDAVLQIGDPAPDFMLPDLDGLPVTLADYRGDHTLLFFWNPGCKFCQRILDELRAWEDDPRRSARLLFISIGTVEENRAQGLRSTILLEEKFETGKRYGVMMTPSAILIDADGRIASLLEIGAENILALTGTPRPAAV